MGLRGVGSEKKAVALLTYVGDSAASTLSYWDSHGLFGVILLLLNNQS